MNTHTHKNYCSHMTLHSSLLVNAFFYHCVKHLYSGTVYPTISKTLLPQHHLNLPSRPIFSPMDSLNALPLCVLLCAIGFVVCVCVCVSVCLSVCVCVSVWWM